jgi:hypothetical protein
MKRQVTRNENLCDSDTHELESEVTIPRCTLLLHCGDWSFFGKNLKAMDAFNDWLGEQPAEYVVITAGNHEYPVAAERDKWRRRLSNATLLLNESTTIDGIKLWASPVTKIKRGFRNARRGSTRRSVRHGSPRHGYSHHAWAAIGHT